MGRTGETLSVIAFGGIVLNGRTPAYAARLVRDAFQAEITHFDVAPQYGTAAELLGPALEPFRSKAFLSCKTLQRQFTPLSAAEVEALKAKRQKTTPLFRAGVAK